MRTECFLEPFQKPQEDTAPMANAVYKKIELVGTSPNSFAEAAANAVAKAAESVRQMSWFEVVEQRGAIADGKVTQFQVTVRIGFRVE
jgi:flavin-binding protein dodecin